MVVGGSTILMGLLGMCICYSSQRRPFFFGYGILMAGILAVSILGTVQLLAAKSQVRKHFNHIWNTSPDRFAQMIQAKGQCCGFDSYTDRIHEPCKAFEPKVGCFPGFMKDRYLSALKYLLVPLLALVVASGLALVLDLAMFAVIYFELEDERKCIRKQEPFDTWHKAIFQ